MRIALTVILAAVLAASAAAAPAPPGIPGVPDIGPPTTAPIGSPPAPTPPAVPSEPTAAPPATAPIAAPAATVTLPASTPPAAPAAPAGPVLSAEEHYAKGEVLFAGAWVPIDNLFRDYLAARVELQPLDAQAKAAREGIAAIQAQMNTMKNDSLQGDLPSRKDMSKQMAKRRDLTKDVEAPAPVKPRLQQVPQQPRNFAANMHSQYSNSSSNQYDQMQQDWQRQADLINQANAAVTKRYQQDQAAWKKAKDDAEKELPKIDQAIKDIQGKISQNAVALTTKQAPLMEKIKAANEEAQTIARRIEAVQTRIRGMAEALKAAPETLRFKHGIIDWEGAFWPLADLEKQLSQTQAEIERICQQMKAEATAAGRPLADNWRHPQQDRMDALGALIARAKATPQLTRDKVLGRGAAQPL
jgi:predicted  nucleic acid-binding Zn-ribbon protein